MTPVIQYNHKNAYLATKLITFCKQCHYFKKRINPLKTHFLSNLSSIDAVRKKQGAYSVSLSNSEWLRRTNHSNVPASAESARAVLMHWGGVYINVYPVYETIKVELLYACNRVLNLYAFNTCVHKIHALYKQENYMAVS